MPIKTRIEGSGQGNANLTEARVSDNGELVVGSLAYSEPYFVSCVVDDVVYNVVDAKQNHRFIVVGILIGAGRDVATDCHVELYEADSADGVSTKEILQLDMNKGQHTYLNLINLSTESSKYINATTDDNTVSVTVFGYYVPDRGE